MYRACDERAGGRKEQAEISGLLDLKGDDIHDKDLIGLVDWIIGIIAKGSMIYRVARRV